MYISSLLSLLFPPKKNLRLVLQRNLTKSLLREPQWFFLFLVNVFPTHFHPGEHPGVCVCVCVYLGRSEGHQVHFLNGQSWASLRVIALQPQPRARVTVPQHMLECCPLPLGPDMHIAHKEIWFAQSLSPVWLCDPVECSLPGSSVCGIS